MSIIVLKGLLGSSEGESLFADIEGFRKIGFGSKILKFELEPDEVLEASLLGHSNLILDQGPLTVAALGWNPPERSLHFHVSMLSLQGDDIQFVIKGPSAEELAVIDVQLERLNTKSLTILKGEGLDNGLVCEKQLDIRTYRPSEAIQAGFMNSQPFGDGENDLRRLIDDSVNILSGLEFNLRRVDQGIAPINLCWPWGQGERQKISNRALELGMPWIVRAHSLATRGLARLSGFQAEKIPLFAEVEFRELLPILQGDAHALTILDLGAMPVGDEQIENRLARLHEFSQVVIEPLLDWQLDTKSNLALVATNRANEGLIALVAKPNERDTLPFDERSLAERKVPRMNLMSLLAL